MQYSAAETPFPVEGVTMSIHLPCPVCGEFTIQEPFDICPRCNWEFDPMDYRYPDDSTGPNHCSLNLAKAVYLSTNQWEMKDKWLWIELLQDGETISHVTFLYHSKQDISITEAANHIQLLSRSILIDQYSISITR